MSIRYGIKDCEHEWVYRKDGWEEGCAPVICRKCGAFGCFCDVNPRPPKEIFFGNGANSSDNIGGQWNNPYIKKPKKLKKKLNS